MAEAWLKVGAVRKADSGAHYIKVFEAVSLKKDDVLQLQNPRTKLKESVAAGRLSEEEAEKRLAALPEYLVYDVVLPPRK